VAGLRERNRLRTREEIKAAALRLIKEQGYASTTVDQIAKAADVSPSTFFRYFPTKEDAVLADDYDEGMMTTFRRQPPELTVLEAFRRTMMEIFGQLSDDEQQTEWLRMRTVFEVPELRDRMLGTLAENIAMLSSLIAERVGRPVDDPKVRHLAGAIVGVAIAVMARSVGDPNGDFVKMLDEGMRDLAAGFPL
jgi:AcrR family transcriptional regulator